MEKEFISYEQALALKELGFNETCFGYYDGNHNFQYMFHGYPERFSERMMGVSNSVWVGWISAPTFSQAFRWFREKHGLQGYVYSTTVRGGKEVKHFSDYCWHINGIDMPFLSTDARDMENVSYEEAELACLTKLIEIVEGQKDSK